MEDAAVFSLSIDQACGVELDAVLAAITPRTRMVFITNPNNPTGVSVPKDAIVFVDEAYAEFAGRSFIPELPAFPNVIVGRTFSKAYGLAAIRIGALIGASEVLDPIRHATPVYSVNVAAVVSPSSNSRFATQTARQSTSTTPSSRQASAIAGPSVSGASTVLQPAGRRARWWAIRSTISSSNGTAVAM